MNDGVYGGESLILRDGAFRIKSEYFKDDAWQPGREALYREAPTAEVVFK